MPVSLLPAGSCFYRFRLDPHAFPPLWFLFDAVFIVFPCPSLIVFSSFSIPFGAALSRFLGFPFVSLTVVACRGAVRYCFPPVPVSSPVSVFELSGGAVLPVPWAGGLFRGVALRGWRGVLPLFVWRLVSTVCGAGRFGWFFHVEIIGGLFVGRGGFVASGGKRTPRRFICSLGAFCLVWLVLYVGCCRSISSCIVRWCGWRWRRRRVGRLRLLPALRLFGRVAGYRPEQGLVRRSLGWSVAGAC